MIIVFWPVKMSLLAPSPMIYVNSELTDCSIKLSSVVFNVIVLCNDIVAVVIAHIRLSPAHNSTTIAFLSFLISVDFLCCRARRVL